MEVVITSIYDKLLRGTPAVPAGLYQLQLLTAEQLTRLHYRLGSIKMVKARLKTLTTHGFVQSDVIPSRKFRTPYYYTLGKQGAKYLESVGCDVGESWRASKETHQHALFVEHTLELNDVLISAFQLPRVSRYRVAQVTHERVLKRTPFKVNNLTLIPDAFLDIREEGRRLPILIEHDRGTEEQYYFRRRIKAYIGLLKSGACQQLFGTKTMTVVFTTFAGAYRVEQMRKWTRAELQGQTEDLWRVFCFANLSRPLEPRSVWLAPNWRTPVEHRPPESLLAA